MLILSLGERYDRLYELTLGFNMNRLMIKTVEYSCRRLEQTVDITIK